MLSFKRQWPWITGSWKTFGMRHDPTALFGGPERKCNLHDGCYTLCYTLKCHDLWCYAVSCWSELHPRPLTFTSGYHVSMPWSKSGCSKYQCALILCSLYPSPPCNLSWLNIKTSPTSACSLSIRPPIFNYSTPSPASPNKYTCVQQDFLGVRTQIPYPVSYATLLSGLFVYTTIYTYRYYTFSLHIGLPRSPMSTSGYPFPPPLLNPSTPCPFTSS